MRDFLPTDVRKREYVIGVIKEVYESYGFEPLETPSVENLETLTGKYGEEGNQLIFKILKRGEKLQEELNEGKIKNENELSDLALRYDLTVPLARVVANHKNDLPKFFKRYQIQPVWRADRPARGRFREFYQCDVDAIGSNSMMVEAELCAAVSEILTRLKFKNFVIRINHRLFLEKLLSHLEIPLEKQTDVLVTIDKLDKIGPDGVSKELEERGIPQQAIVDLVGIFKFMLVLSTSVDLMTDPNADGDINIGFNKGFLSQMSDKFQTDSLNIPGLADLEQILELTDSLGCLSKVRIDPTLVRGLSYYTGAIFEISVPDLAGSLGGGGRYDGLIGMFGKEQIPACGFSLGLERILVVMEERGMFQKLVDEGKLKLDSADVMVTIWNAESVGESLKLANQIREESKAISTDKKGLRVLVYPETDKLGKQFKYADSIKVPFVCVLGETELAENKVTLKNLRTGEQETVLREEIAAKVNVL